MSGCRLFRITGRVQGVFFRASTRDVAVDLGITGHAKNLPDGSVEVLACGPPDALQQLANWLQHGPRMAEVENVSASVVDCPPPAVFSTG